MESREQRDRVGLFFCGTPGRARRENTEKKGAHVACAERSVLEKERCVKREQGKRAESPMEPHTEREVN